ncbi:hypothetical protein BDZ88DRAFT_414536 [Geranomyces variabilis]|nr:hypothetical protein BDZ88DRAFT_414536 [Geranomyces variabilis]
MRFSSPLCLARPSSSSSSSSDGGVIGVVGGLASSSSSQSPSTRLPSASDSSPSSSRRPGFTAVPAPCTLQAGEGTPQSLPSLPSSPAGTRRESRNVESPALSTLSTPPIRAFDAPTQRHSFSTASSSSSSSAASSSSSSSSSHAASSLASTRPSANATAITAIPLSTNEEQIRYLSSLSSLAYTPADNPARSLDLERNYTRSEIAALQSYGFSITQCSSPTSSIEMPVRRRWSSGNAESGNSSSSSSSSGDRGGAGIGTGAGGRSEGALWSATSTVKKESGAFGMSSWSKRRSLKSMARGTVRGQRFQCGLVAEEV